jgi:excinuclease ABC subunit C
MYEKGLAALRQALDQMPDFPGIYEMMDEKDQVLYVGKAKRLVRRVVSYTRVNQLTLRLQRMVSNIRSVRYTVTHNELEALLLEQNVIHKKKPPFNILLKEGKSPLYLTLTSHPFPGLMAKRGNASEGQQRFGPFLNSDLMDATKTYVHKAFQLRSCTDRVFSSRRRPCLQYYIKNCSAPCVDKISLESYQQSVEGALHILKGRSDALEQNLLQAMQYASSHHAYEKAAVLRDQLKWIHQAKTAQSVGNLPKEDVDVIAGEFAHGVTCIQLSCFRQGSNYGGQHFFFPQTRQEDMEDVFKAFIQQFYVQVPPPPTLILGCVCEDLEELFSFFQAMHHTKVKILCAPKDKERQKILSHVILNAQHALTQYVQSHDETEVLLARMQSIFCLSQVPRVVEVFDNSHFQGHYSYAGMVRFEEGVWNKKGSKCFSMGKTSGDDHALLREMLIRRYAKHEAIPDLILVDGGKGQVSTAQQTLVDLGLAHVNLVGIAKGPYHRDGQETFYSTHQTPVQLEETDPLLHLLQRMRNQAHQHVIQAHRRHRNRAELGKSVFDQLPGVGRVRKQQLLCRFPDADALRKASVADLQAVPGFSKTLAESVYCFVQGDTEL